MILPSLTAQILPGKEGVATSKEVTESEKGGRSFSGPVPSLGYPLGSRVFPVSVVVSPGRDRWLPEPPFGSSVFPVFSKACPRTRRTILATCSWRLALGAVLGLLLGAVAQEGPPARSRAMKSTAAIRRGWNSAIATPSRANRPRKPPRPAGDTLAERMLRYLPGSGPRGYLGENRTDTRHKESYSFMRRFEITPAVRRSRAVSWTARTTLCLIKEGISIF